MSFVCNCCKERYKTSRGLSNHRVQGSCGQASMRQVLAQRPTQKVGWSSQAQAPDLQQPSDKQSAEEENYVFGEMDALFEHLTQEVEAADDVAEPTSNENFPSPSHSSMSETEEGGDAHVSVGDTTSLPEEVTLQMFQKPDGFGPGWLKSMVGKDGHPGFTPNYDKTMSAEEKSSIHLLRILDGKELCLFDQIQGWRHQADAVEGRQGRSKTQTTRKATIDGIISHLGFSGLLPKSHMFQLPNTGVMVDLQVFSLRTCSFHC